MRENMFAEFGIIVSPAINIPYEQWNILFGQSGLTIVSSGCISITIQIWKLVGITNIRDITIRVSVWTFVGSTKYGIVESTPGTESCSSEATSSAGTSEPSSSTLTTKSVIIACRGDCNSSWGGHSNNKY